MLRINTWVRFFVCTLCITATTQALGHGRWMLPSHTVLSGEPLAVAFDLSISNDLFHPDLAVGGSVGGDAHPGPRATVTVTAPDGTRSDIEYLAYLGRKSAFMHKPEDNGTYTYEAGGPPVTFYDYALPTDERHHRAFNPASIPDEAINIHQVVYHARLETHVTLNAPTRLKPRKTGLALSGQHPNDLFAGEGSAWQITFDGKPVTEGARVLITRGNTRHRDARGTINVESDNQGVFTVTLSAAGFYLIEVEYDANSNDAMIPAHIERHSLFTVIEVLP